MHSFKASSDLFISAPSNFVCCFYSETSEARSLPAKSINDTFPYDLLLLSFRFICRIAWDREESSFWVVDPI